MANYNTLKNAGLRSPEGNIDLGSPTRTYGNIYISSNLAIGSTQVTANNIIAPRIASVDYPGDDLAANPAGGDTITLLGSGFQSGATVLIDSATVGVVTVVSDSQINFVSPVKVAGTYVMYVVNPDGGTAILLPGISYSGTPTWTTAAGSLGSIYETASVNTVLAATGDTPVTFSLFSGTLPTGTTLAANGTLSGTAPATAGSTTYNFTIRATDAQNQDTDRAFSLTINTDVVTWNSPANGYDTTVYEYSTISNVTMNATSVANGTITYTANSLPAGISISGNTVYGTPTTVANTVSNITATATSTRTANRTLNFNVLQDVVTWSSPADGTNYAVSANTAINNVSLSAASAAGQTITYSANALPTGISLSGDTISGTPTTVSNVATLLTATAATTNRSATRTITWTVSLATVLTDAYWNLTSLLLSGNTAVQTASFVADNSTNNTQLTVVGDSRAQNFNPYQAGYYSVQFNGSTDYLSVPDSDVFLISGDVTVEAWVYQTSSKAVTVIAQWPAAGAVSFLFRIESTGKLSFAYDTGGGGANATVSTLAITYNTWCHVAWVRSGTTFRYFINGVQDATTNTISGSFVNSAGAVTIGLYNTGVDTYFNGYISNIRFVKGLALYTTTFTPSTTPLLNVPNTSLLICQSNRFADASTNNLTVTAVSTPKINSANPFTTVYQAGTQYYSGSFNGSSDYLTVPSTFALPSSTTPFTIECWVYPLTQLSGTGIFSTPNNTGIGYALFGASSISSNTSGSNLCGGYYNGSSWIGVSSSTSLTLNTWSHIAMVFTGTVVTLYLNGVSIGSTTTSWLSSGYSTPFYIGRRWDATASPYFNGYISNFRFVSGTAVYTGNFVPPTAPLAATQSAGTNIAAITGTQTSLLTCQSSTFVDNSTNAFTITAATATVKPLAQSPFTPLYYSNYFNGSDYLTLPASSIVDYGTGDFNFEAWVYLVGTSSTQTIIASRFWVQVGPTTMDLTSAGVVTIYSLTGLTNIQNTWSHIAVSRQSGTLRSFRNGTLVDSRANSTNFELTGGKIGIESGSLINPLTGYISNLRSIKGQAIYTAAFTPSTAPLTTTSQGATASNVTLLTCQSPYFIDTSTNSYALTTGGSPRIAGTAPFTQPGGYSATAVTTWGSGYYNNTGASNTAWITGPTLPTFGTLDHTIEFWIYNDGTMQTYANPWTYYGAATQQATNNYYISVNPTNVSVGLGGGGSWLLSGLSTTATPVNTWAHVAVTRQGTTFRLFVNGTLGATVTGVSASIAAPGGPMYIATYNANAANGNYVKGYITDFRIVLGTAVYTSSFVPSFTTPLAAVANTRLLTLQTNGAHNNSTFVDNSGFNNLITRSGNATNGTFSPYGNNFSNYFATTASYISAPIASFPYSGTTWTIEGWFNASTVAGTVGFFTSPGLLECKYSGTTFTLAYRNVPASPVWTNYTATVTLTAATWYHIAVSVAAGSMRLFINGTQYGTTTTVTAGIWDGSGSNTVIIGANDNYVFGSIDSTLAGYASNFRITNTAVYTANFTPTTTPLTAITGTTLLTCQGNRFFDVSPLNNTITVTGTPTVQKFSPFATVTVPTYYSGYFDGTGDYLTATITALGSSDWTIEAWVYPTRSATEEIPIGCGPGASGSWELFLSYPGYASKVRFNIYGDTNVYVSSTNYNANAWNHIAAVRSGSNITVYLNGVGGTSTAINPSYNNSTVTGLVIGRGYTDSTAGSFIGYVSNARITKGQALYTTAFTPSTTPLTTTSQGATAANVSLLTCQSNTFIDNSPNYFTITANGDAKPLAVSPFTATASSAVSYTPTAFGGSMYFDGTGDYLSLASAPITTTGNFTAEAWVYASGASDGAIFYLLGNTASYAGFRLGWTGGATPGFYILHSQNGSTWAVNSTTSIGGGTQNTWYHVAVTRNGTAGAVYINGVSVYTFTWGTLYAGTLNFIGAYQNTSFVVLTGYISDARITNSVLYTANFYPGASPATPTYTIGTTTYNSSLLLSGTAGGIIDSTRTINLETVADAKVTPFSPYNGSYYSVLTTNANYHSVSMPALGTVFTIEYWVYVLAVNDSAHHYEGASTGPLIGYDGLGLGFKVAHQGAWTVTSNTQPPIGSWCHIAVVREGTGANQCKIYVNGVLTGTGTESTTFGAQTAYLSRAGYTTNFRVVNNQAVYTGNFVPSTAPLTATSVGSTGGGAAASLTGTVLLLTYQSNKFIDNGPGALTLTTATGTPKVATQNPFQLNTGASYYFDGTGDWLIAPDNPGIQLGTGDFTVEFWAYPASSSGYRCAVAKGSASTGWAVFADTGGNWAYTDTNTNTISTTAARLGVWAHLALVRSGTSMKLYLNGVSIASTTSSTNFNQTNQLVVGAGRDLTIPWNGYIADLRITKGYARYTTTFTPPTTDLTTK